MFKRFILRLTKRISQEVERDAKGKITQELISVLENAGKLGLVPRLSEIKGDTSIGLGIRVYVASGKREEPIHISIGDSPVASDNLFSVWTSEEGYKKLLGGKSNARNSR
jgi:hypothetical protein